ncbi:hypothetical protein PGQ11_007848 [Apiospora arundinis]|uniref:Uncharacterized protein n=1 Tax=Apiospora arundinis TaxID=335852 RepID=A0ABR2IWN8_9PEZI
MSGKASTVAALNKKLNRKERLLLQHKYTVAEKKVAEKARALAERTGCPYVEVHFNHEEKVDDVFLRALDDLENKQMRFFRLFACDGGRPECEPCNGRGSCVYDNKNGQAQIQELRGGNEQLKYENEQLTCQMSRLESAIKSMLPADTQRAPEIPPEQQFMGSISEEPTYAEQLTNTVLWPSLLVEQQPASPSQCPKGWSRAESDLRWNSSCPYERDQLMCPFRARIDAPGKKANPTQ